MESTANEALREYRQKVMARKEKEEKKAAEEKKKKSGGKSTGILKESKRLQPGRKAKEAPKPAAKSAKKSAGGASKANSKTAVNKRLLAAKKKLLEKTSETETRKKGKDRMRKIASELDTEDEGEQTKRRSSKKPTDKSKSSQGISWKNPVTDVDSSNEDDDDRGEGEYEEESDHNVTFSEVPDDSGSGEDSDDAGYRRDSSDSSDSEDEKEQKRVMDRHRQKKKQQMPLSLMIPKALWPRGMTKEAIDSMDIETLERLQAHDIALRTLEGSKEEKNPGKIVDETGPTMTKVFVESGYHDFLTKFSPAQFLHFPLSPPAQWWKFVAVAYEEITPEFGHEERGITGRIARSTWVSAHNRKVSRRKVIVENN